MKEQLIKVGDRAQFYLGLSALFFNWVLWVGGMTESIKNHKGGEHLLNEMVSPCLFSWMIGLWCCFQPCKKMAQEEEEDNDG